MKYKWVGYGLLPLLLIGSSVEIALHTVFMKVPQYAPPPPAQNEVILAPAIIDAVNDVTRVPTLQSGVVKTIDVTLGQFVKKGDPLFSLNSDLIENSVNINQLTLEQTKNGIRIQTKQLQHLQKQLARLKSLDHRAISRSELQEKIHEINMAKAQLTQAQFTLALTTANLKNVELTRNQFTTVAPKDGIVLQINGHLNEFVGASQQIVLLGDAKKIIVRVSLDERDIRRFQRDAPANLLNYENPALNIPLTFMQLDQYIVNQERLNSRVQEALYYFEREKYPNYVAGQLFDAQIALRKVA